MSVIESGMITTVHNLTGTQPMVDMANAKKKDLRANLQMLGNVNPSTDQDGRGFCAPVKIL